MQAGNVDEVQVQLELSMCTHRCCICSKAAMTRAAAYVGAASGAGRAPAEVPRGASSWVRVGGDWTGG